jgi:hypothetical protein|tara:strand:+ start:3417 stop:3656 length:240 start_codon:yes stop_codon:yes gene_type:complete
VDYYDPYFKVGDFVKCSYERFPFLYDWYEEDENSSFFVYHGVVVYADGTHHEYLDEFIYEVLCLDGEKRYFMESELSRM